MNPDMPEEFDIIKTVSIARRRQLTDIEQNPSGIGYTMKGWDFNKAEIIDALQQDRMLNPAFELGWNVCPWSCDFCFSEDPHNPDGLKVKLKDEMNVAQKLKLIREAKELGARTINIVGAGEPTTDPDFWKMMELIAQLEMTPVLYTEGTLKLTKKEFSRRLYDLGATVVLKVNSLENESYQNAVVNGGERKKHPVRKKDGLILNYFQERNRVLNILMELGFNNHDPTRLAFDTIICRENVGEITGIHDFARRNNIFVLFVNYLPSGRSCNLLTNAISKEEQFGVFEKLAQIDLENYGLKHQSTFPYAGGTPCSIRGLGVYVKVQGEVWDCPGESQRLGSIRQESLKDLWEKSAHIRRRFNGGCEPRELFWKKHNESAVRKEGTKTTLKIIG